MTQQASGIRGRSTTKICTPTYRSTDDVASNQKGHLTAKTKTAKKRTNDGVTAQHPSKKECHKFGVHKTIRDNIQQGARMYRDLVPDYPSQHKLIASLMCLRPHRKGRNDVLYMWGPPGTGKTMAVARVLDTSRNYTTSSTT